VSPARRRDAVRFLVKRRRVSERRACRIVGQHRPTQRYERVAAEYELKLVARMNELAALHPRGIRGLRVRVAGTHCGRSSAAVSRLVGGDGNNAPVAGKDHLGHGQPKAGPDLLAEATFAPVRLVGRMHGDDERIRGEIGESVSDRL
jgi:hypothetical protein